MRRDKKEQQKEKKLQELQSAIVNQVFTNEYATLKITAVDFIGECYQVKWMCHELTHDAIYAHELRQWIASRYKIRYYDLELKRLQ
jgi:hypothetical protein